MGIEYVQAIDVGHITGKAVIELIGKKRDT
jgi:hypothetical protein